MRNCISLFLVISSEVQRGPQVSCLNGKPSMATLSFKHDGSKTVQNILCVSYLNECV